MESWKCDPCGKSFTGLVCFQQHEASEKHKKKVRLLNGTNFALPNPVNTQDSMNQIQDSLSDSMNRIHCSVCQVSISGLDNYLKHSNSLEHALMVQKKNNDLLSSSLSSTFELKGEHNQLLQATVPLAGSTRPVAAFAECKPCGKEFSGPEPYQQHLLSVGHRKKCGPLSQTMQKDETDSIMRKENIDDNLPNESLSSMHNTSGTDPQIFAKCDVCEMEFYEALPYQIHLISDLHKMKVKSQLLVNSLAESRNELKCDICHMIFSGPMPYQQHIVSNGHRKKMITAGLSTQNAATGSLLSPDYSLINSQKAHSIVDPEWYCNTCKIQCSGPIPFNTHINGKEHSKTLRILMVEENLRKIKALGSFTHVVNDEIDSDSSNKVTSTSNINSESEALIQEDKINNLNVNSDDTKVLSDKYHINDLIALPNLNIIPPEKLDIAVFQPDEEIIFSNLKKNYQESL